MLKSMGMKIFIISGVGFDPARINVLHYRVTKELQLVAKFIMKKQNNNKNRMMYCKYCKTTATSLIKFLNNTGALMLDSIDHTTLRLLKNHIFDVKSSRACHLLLNRYNGRH